MNLKIIRPYFARLFYSPPLIEQEFVNGKQNEMLSIYDQVLYICQMCHFRYTDDELVYRIDKFHDAGHQFHCVLPRFRRFGLYHQYQEGNGSRLEHKDTNSRNEESAIS